MSRIALAASITHALVAVGHTIKGLDTFSLPPYRSLPPLLLCYAKAGWYQGSGFFAILSLWTYQLSKRPVASWTDMDRMILGALTALYWASSAWYLKHGDKGTGFATAVGGAVTAAVIMQ